MTGWVEAKSIAQAAINRATANQWPVSGLGHTVPELRALSALNLQSFDAGLDWLRWHRLVRESTMNIWLCPWVEAAISSDDFSPPEDVPHKDTTDGAKSADPPVLRVGFLGSPCDGQSALFSSITRVLAREGLASPVSVSAIYDDPSARTPPKTGYIAIRSKRRSYALSISKTPEEIVRGLVFHEIATDGAVLLVSTIDGVTRSIRDQIRLARNAGVPAMIGFVNRSLSASDQVTDAVVELELREQLAKFGYDPELVIIGQFADAKRTVDDAEAASIWELMDLFDRMLPTPIAPNHQPWMIPIEDSGQLWHGSASTFGRLQRGTIHVGSIGTIWGCNGKYYSTTADIEQVHLSIASPRSGDTVNVMFSSNQAIQRGDIAAAPGSLKTAIRIAAEAYFLGSMEGFPDRWRVVEECTFYMNCMDRQGILECLAGESQLPAGAAGVVITFRQPVVVEEGMTFSIRRGGLTMGYGSVSRLLS